MRPIKFRAWDKDSKKMRRVIGFEMGLDGDIEDCKMLVSRDKKGFNWTVYDDIILMQFTGLKDKNGKEIYVGDIIISSWYYDEPTKIKDLEHFFWAIGEYMLEAEDIEVIGNICEQPEILK